MDTATPTTETLDHIPLNLIRVSSLGVQALRRQRFSADSLIELAASIKQLGIQQPIVVRAIAGTAFPIRYEIVCGERRFLAADRAGLTAVPAVVRDLDDTQALEVLMSENLGRADMHALEEGVGFKALMQQRHLDAAGVGALFGKSRSYVYGRVKLLDLIPDARDALQRGELDPSKALLIARIPAEKAQQRALSAALRMDWRGETISYKTLFDELHGKTLRDLADVKWPLALTGLTDPARGTLPACTECPHYSGNDPDLAGGDPDAHVCADGGCFDDKGAAWAARLRAELEADGATILTGDAAKAILPGRHCIIGHVDLDHECVQDEFPDPLPQRAEGEDDATFSAREDAYYEDAETNHKYRTFRALLAGAALQSVWVADPHTGEMRELAPVQAARDHLHTAHNITLPDYVGEAPVHTSRLPLDENQRQAQADRAAHEQRELKTRVAIFEAIAAQCSGKLTTEDLIAIAEELLDYDTSDRITALYGDTITPAKLKPDALPKLIRLLLLRDCADNIYNSDKPLLAAAKRWNIDVSAIKKQVAAAVKAEHKSTAQ